MIISNKEDRFIQSAIEQAEMSPCLMRHGCVAVRNGRIVGRGYNNYRCRSKDGFINNCMTCHAEIAALREVNKRETKRFNRIILYVVRLDSKNELQESAPCIDCMNLIQGLQIKRVFHSTNGGDIAICQPCNFYTNHVTTGKKVLVNIMM
jgi:deoxycytidylate deaminase